MQDDEVPMNNKKNHMLHWIRLIVITLCIITVTGCDKNKLPSSNVITIINAKTLITLESEGGNAIAIQGNKILKVGNTEQLAQSLKAMYPDTPIVIDTQFENDVLVPGFINQHDHPWLGALTLSSNIISFEDWVLPHKTYPKASTEIEYQLQLKKLLSEHKNKDELFLSWGYHKLWHGELTRQILDDISNEVPIAIWQRSVHEFIVNSKALALFEIDQAVIDGLTVQQKSQTNLAEGHFWESGMLALSGNLFKHLVKPKQYIESLEMVKNYWHSAGSTLVVEPGGLVNKNLSILQNHVFSSDDNPFHMDYIVDGKTMALQHMDNLLEKTADIHTWAEGMSRFIPKQIKLFSDGAVFSQLMQMSEGYTDGHHGEWIMEPELFKQAFKQYWDAGYQIHVHQNGDAGLDLVLDALEENMQRNPRKDHRTVIVHFSYSRADQVKRLNDLGAIVSVNPYYPVALAEMYSKVGVGEERSHAMVRMGDLNKHGVNFSLHSDMPMAPGQPLFLMWCAVNRISINGNVIGPEQAITPEQALRGVTINAAYSMQLEHELGSLKAGKTANITVLKDNPLTVDPVTIKDIEVVATVHEGRILPVKKGMYREVSFWEMIPVYWTLMMAKF
jgi:predicted amidohydrolase YtcJ